MSSRRMKKKSPTVSVVFQVGELVAFCPPAAIGKTLLARHLVAPGRCPGGSVALAKRVAALGAVVCAGPGGVAVDGAWANGQP